MSSINQRTIRFELTPDGDVVVIVIEHADISSFESARIVMPQQDFKRQAGAILWQFSPQFRDGITDVLPPEEGDKKCLP